MLYRFEIKAARGAPFVQFHIVSLIRPIWHISGGRIGDRGQYIAQGRITGLGLILKAGNLVFLFCNKGAQALEFGFITAGLGRPHIF